MIVLAFTSLHLISEAQDCKVLLESISSEYYGPCKKGLANGKATARGVDEYVGNFKNGLPHGKGTYKWANGDKYEGNWKNGMRHGKGTFSYRKDGQKLELTGIWKNNEYLKEEKIAPYTRGHINNLDRYTIKRVGDGDKILITYYDKGSVSSPPSDYIFQLDSGSWITTGQAHGYEGVTFPANVKITYTITSKGMSTKVRFEIIINQPGEWEIKLYNAFSQLQGLN